VSEHLLTKELSMYRPNCPVVQFVKSTNADSKWSIVQFGVYFFEVKSDDIIANVKEFLDFASKSLN